MNAIHLLVPCLARHASALEIPANPTATEFNKLSQHMSPAQLVAYLKNDPTLCASSVLTYSVMENMKEGTLPSEALKFLYGELSLMKFDNPLMAGVKPIMFQKFTKLALAQEWELQEWGAHLIPIHREEMGDDWDVEDEETDYVTARQSFQTYCRFAFTERGSSAPSCEPFKRIASTVSALPGSGIQEWRPRK